MDNPNLRTLLLGRRENDRCTRFRKKTCGFNSLNLIFTTVSSQRFPNFRALAIKKCFAFFSGGYSILRMVTVEVSYLGDLRTKAIHAPSKSIICTDAPVDNFGRGELFSPTDLVGAALGTCVLTILGIYAQKHSLDVSGASASVEKEMTATPVRRISRLETTIRIPLSEQNEHREAIERAILSCPVHASLLLEIEKPITFVWGE